MRNIDLAKCLALGIGLSFLPSVSADAQGRPDVRNMSCAEARSLVWQQGAAVLSTGRHTYDRYVSSERFCAVGNVAERAYVGTRDASTCAIGYTCEADMSDRRDPWWLRLRRR